MGVDKAALPVGRTTWLAHIARQAMLTSCPVAVIGRGRTDDETMPDVLYLGDEKQCLGPIGGLLTALRYADGPVLAVACDMPFLTSASFYWLLSRANDEVGELGLAVRSSTGLEPLFSYYTPSCLPVIDQRIAERRFSLQSMIAQPEFRTIEAPAWIQDALRNVNTVGDRLRLGL